MRAKNEEEELGTGQLVELIRFDVDLLQNNLEQSD
jgi:hypothetical protein